MVGCERRDHRPVRALPEGLGCARREIDAHRPRRRLLTGLDGEVRDLGRIVDVHEVGAAADERLGRERLGKATVERNRVRKVVLVPVGVDHHDDAAEAGEDVKQVTADELRVLERDLRRQERLGDASRRVHGVEAQVAGEVRGEGDAVARELRLDEQARSEERLDPVRSPPRCVRRRDRHRFA